MAINKKRIIKSLDNLSEELRNLLKKQYPLGYENSISRIKNAKNEPIFVFPLETEDTVFLIKVPVTKNSQGDYDVDSRKDPEDDHSEEDDYGDKDFASGNDDDYDEEERGGTRQEASYDPDFDN